MGGPGYRVALPDFRMRIHSVFKPGNTGLREIPQRHLHKGCGDVHLAFGWLGKAVFRSTLCHAQQLVLIANKSTQPDSPMRSA